MASNYSTNLKIELIAAGEQAGTWGDTTNTNLGTALEEAIVGYGAVTFSNANLTLTLTNSNSTQAARCLVLNVGGGTLTETRSLIVPTINKPYVVQNNTTGGQSIFVTTDDISGVTIPNGKSAIVYVDGTNVVSQISHIPSLTLGSALPLASGGTGATTASAARTSLGSTTVGDALFTAADATAAQQAMDTEVGVDVQAYDAGLDDISGLAVTDGNFIVGDGANWVAESGATARTSLGLGTLATQSPTGTPSSSTFLRGDNQWAAPPSVDTSAVLSATAGASTGAVGTYAYLALAEVGSTTYSAGTNFSGSRLRYAGVGGTSANNVVVSGTPSGSWKLMGYIRQGQTDGYGAYYFASMFLRYA